MARRIHKCTNCGASVEVPDMYLRAPIQCGDCGAMLDHELGSLAHPSAAEPQPAHSPPNGDALAPLPTFERRAAFEKRPSAPDPTVPGQQGLPNLAQAVRDMSPLARKSSPWLAIALIVGGIVVVIGAVVAFSMITKAAADAAIPDKAEWVSFTSADGQFSALFPFEPQVMAVDNADGKTIHATRCSAGPHAFEVNWVAVSMNEEPLVGKSISALVEAVGGEVTRRWAIEYKGKPARAGEIDDGRYKYMVFATKTRVWLISAGDYREDFQYFLENVTFSDEALDIPPLELTEYLRSGGLVTNNLFLNVESALSRRGLRATGGKPPYVFTHSGAMPRGVSGVRKDSDVTSEDFWKPKGAPAVAVEAPWMLEGVPTEAGLYPITVTVTDAEGRKKDMSLSIVVESRQEPFIWLVHSDSRFDSPRDPDLIIEVTSGNYAEVALDLRTVLRRSSFRVTEVSMAEGSPAWARASRGGSGYGTGGADVSVTAPCSAGDHVVRLVIVAKSVETNLLVTFEQPVTIRVIGVPVEEATAWVTKPPDLTIRRYFGEYVRERLEFKFQKPDGWNAAQEWRVNGNWNLVDVSLPRGLKLESGESRGGSFRELEISGQLEETGTWACSVKMQLEISGAAGPIEYTQRLTIEVIPIEDLELPVELVSPAPEWTIQGVVGTEINATWYWDFSRPKAWPEGINWGPRGEWELNPQHLPAGLWLDKPFRPTGLPSRLSIRGIPTVAGEWNLEAKISLTLHKFPETIEVVVPIKIVIE